MMASDRLETAETTVLAASWVLPLTSPPIRDGAVLVEEGKVAWVGPRSELPAPPRPARLIARPASILLPGWMNAHAHLNLTAAAGLLPAGDDGFTGWVRRLIATTERWPSSLVDQSVTAGLDLLLASGTTTVVHQSTLPRLDRFLNHPVRSIVLHEVIGFKDEWCERLLAEARTWLEQARRKCRGTRVQPGLAVHSLYSSGPRLARALAATARECQVPFAVHLAETQDELQFLHRGTGPFRDLLAARGAWDESWRPPQCSPVELADSLGLLAAPGFAAHCNYLTRDDASLLARGSLRPVWCPGSHAFFGHSQWPAELLSQAGTPVCLGTDSLASNNSLDMLREARLAIARAPAGAAEEWLATAAGSGWPSRAGAGISPGAPADLQLVVLDSEPPDPIRALIEDVYRIELVMIDGERVFPREHAE